MSMGVQPTNGYCVVQLGALMQLKHIQTQVGKYDTHTDGIVVAVPDGSKFAHLVGKHIYWDEFKQGIKVTRGDIQYAFIKLEDIQGYDEEDTPD